MNINELPLIKCKNLSTVSKLEDSETIIFGAPLYGCTHTTFISPSNLMRIFSERIEDNISTNAYISDLRIYDLGDLTSFNIEDYAVDIQTLLRYLDKTVENNKIIAIGGDHLISYNIIKFREPEVLIIFDAHLDLKDSYMFNKFNNATVMRRVRDFYRGPILYFGVRAYDEEEYSFVKNDGKIKLNDFDILDKFENYRAYLSIDIDVLDPSYIRQVDYPEVMGYKFSELITELKKIAKHFEIREVDIVEYSPRRIDVSEINLLLRLLYTVAYEISKSN